MVIRSVPVVHVVLFADKLSTFVSDNNFANSESADPLFFEYVDKGVHLNFGDCENGKYTFLTVGLR